MIRPGAGPFEAETIAVHKLLWLLIFIFVGFWGIAGCEKAALSNEKSLLLLQGDAGPGLKRKLVFVSGDEEYRSEEALPQLARILAKHHGFDCVVLFAIHPDTGKIDPNFRHNIPGLDHLRDADAMVIATRFRDLPDNQMKEIDDYLNRGGPVIGLRTATHGFNIPKEKKYAHYGNGYQGELKFWRGGFGRAVLGEKWISHHGSHRQESTRGIVAENEKKHPITRGIKDGDIWGPTDVYGVRLPLPGDSQTIILGQVLSGMQPNDDPVKGVKNNPLMPIAWTKSYQLPGGDSGKVFTTTMGSSNDLLSAGLRRLIVQGIYWAVGLEESIPSGGLRVNLVAPYNPSDFGFRSDEYWLKKNLNPVDF